jgi:ketosteroid isomerase-like protein
MRTLTLALALTLVSITAAAAPAEKEVLTAMDAWKQAMLNKDKAVFEKVFHPDLAYGHSSGVIENKAQAIQHVVGGTARYVAVNLTDTKVQVHGATAIVTGKAEYQERSKDNKDSTTNLVVLSVWVKGPQGWQMLARQATKPTAPAAPTAAAK